MRGSVAKRIRRDTASNENYYEFMKSYRKAKRVHADAKRTQTPKLEVNPRWMRSPLRRAKKVVDGLHFQHCRPIRDIYKILDDLTIKGVKAATNLSRRGDLPRVVLIQKISELRGLYGKEESERREKRILRSEGDES